MLHPPTSPHPLGTPLTGIYVYERKLADVLFQLILSFLIPVKLFMNFGDYSDNGSNIFLYK